MVFLIYASFGYHASLLAGARPDVFRLGFSTGVARLQGSGRAGQIPRRHRGDLCVVKGRERKKGAGFSEVSNSSLSTSGLRLQ